MKFFLFFYFFLTVISLASPQVSFAQAATDSANPQASLSAGEASTATGSGNPTEATNSASSKESIPEWIRELPSKVSLSPAGTLLDWSIQNYSWKCAIKSGANCDSSILVVKKMWQDTITYIVTPLIILGILVVSVILIAGHGQDIGISSLAVRLFLSLIFIALSYSIIHFLYQFSDIMQGFFLRHSFTQPCPPTCISYTDLVPVGLDIGTLIGLITRLISTLDFTVIPSIIIWIVFTILAHIVFFVVSTVLMFRKIVLWLMLILSPLFPLTFIFPKGRLLSKGIIGSFLAFVFYAPVIALLINITSYIFGILDLGLLNSLAAWILSTFDYLIEGVVTVIILIIDIALPILLFKQVASHSTAISDDVTFMKVLSKIELVVKSILNNLPKDTPQAAIRNLTNKRLSFFIKKNGDIKAAGKDPGA